MNCILEVYIHVLITIKGVWMSNSLKPSSSRASEVGLHQSHDECPNFQKLQDHLFLECRKIYNPAQNSKVINQLFKIFLLLTSHKLIVFCFKLMTSSTLESCGMAVTILLCITLVKIERTSYCLIFWDKQNKRQFCARMTIWYRTGKLWWFRMLW